MLIPPELRYSQDHEWVRLDGELATIGITDFAQDRLNDIVYVDLPAAGATFAQFGQIGEIESIKSVSDLQTPLAGEVVERNQAVLDHPEIINQSPYAEGWLIKLRPAEPAQYDSLLSADAYAELTSMARE